jgi:serine phosphatase RsbU (regulator of sigma subunit)
MDDEAPRSPAFKLAALKSENYRITGLMYLLLMLLAYSVVRLVWAGRIQGLLAQAGVLVLAIAYELAMLGIVRRDRKRQQFVPEWFWSLNVLIESQLPTIGLLLLIRGGYLKPDQALVAPAVFLYFLFITLSTLRLSSLVSLLSGTLSAGGYLVVVIFTLTREGEHMGSMPRVVYFVYAGLIFAAGIVAAFVAAQIRGHVTAALREAELQGQLDQVNHDLEVARTIQQGLFPDRPPRLDGYEVAGWNQPADQTGGDYFDWQTLPDGRVAISLGDATGHGIGPALISASCRGYARASFAADGGRDSVLDQLNQLLAEDLPSNRFITFAVVLFEPATARVVVLSAGHGPILWSRYSEDRIESLDAQGIPLGMLAGVKYEPGTELRLEDGDMLVMITDGFYEWEDPDGEAFGLERLETVIRGARDCSPDDVILRLREAVIDFSRGTSQMDDLTAVILKRSKL